MKEKWYIDKYLPNRHSYHRIRKILFQKKTKFQKIQIFDLFDFGKSLVIDEMPQSSENDEWIYHECLIHPSLILQPINKNLEVLVLGTGEGATLREILKYKNIKKITAVDIDKEAVEIFQKFFYKIHQNSFWDPKVTLVFDSAENFLKRTTEKYDLIFFDITDIIFFNLGKIKESPSNFFQNIYKKLKKNGTFTMHTSNLTEVNYKTHFKMKRLLKKVFPKVYSYRVYIPFFSNYWGFLFASPKVKFNPLKISQKFIENKIKKHQLEKNLKYFSSEIYKSIFTLPPFLKKFEIL